MFCFGVVLMVVYEMTDIVVECVLNRLQFLRILVRPM